MQPGFETHGGLFHDRCRVSPAIAGRDDFRRFIEVHGTPSVTRIFRVFSYLNQLYRNPRTVGFKLMYTHLRRHPELLLYFAARRVSIVHLVRRNCLDIVVSEELARLLGTSHAQAGQKIDVAPVYIDPANLVDRLSRRRKNSEQINRLLRLSTCQHIEVTYEALRDGAQEFERLAKFLGLAQWSYGGRSNIAKRGTECHRDAIANYEEVRQALSSTQFLSLLR